MTKKIIIASAAVLLIAVIIVASVKGGGPKGEKVYAEAVKPRDIQAVVTAPGETDPRVKVNTSPQSGGKIDRLSYKEGDAVRKGKNLVNREKSAYQAQYDRARPGVANRRIE